MHTFPRLPTIKERIAFVLIALVPFLVLEYFTLGWFSEIDARTRLLMGHIGLYMTYIAAILGVFAFLWHKKFKTTEESATATKYLNDRVAAAYRVVQERNEGSDFSEIITTAEQAATEASDQLTRVREYGPTSTFTAYLALVLLGIATVLQILSLG